MKVSGQRGLADLSAKGAEDTVLALFLARLAASCASLAAETAAGSSTISGVVEDPAVVSASRLAQLAARRAKKGAKTVSSAPLADKPADHPKPFTEDGGQYEAGAMRRFCNAFFPSSSFFVFTLLAPPPPLYVN